ncbi:MAG: hypothetical protein JWO66_454 [Candidatus Eremiobacteraeota bacterium]|nr:hypothetical protein [Candidatus Eremiobacteraeota bacterium]
MHLIVIVLAAMLGIAGSLAAPSAGGGAHHPAPVQFDGIIGSGPSGPH